MFGPDWQEGCPSCSFNMDHTDGALVHLEQCVALAQCQVVALQAEQVGVAYLRQLHIEKAPAQGRPDTCPKEDR